MLRHTFIMGLALAGALLHLPSVASAQNHFSSFSLISSAHAEDAAAVKYTCPMHPQIISDTPGTCPICGMTLVPMQSGQTQNEETGKPVIAIDSGTIQKMNVQVEKVENNSVPSSAILRGSDDAHVIVALGDGKFQVRAVTTGNADAGRTPILSGLSDGESVVTRAQFLIDSESNLREALGKVQGNQKQQ